MEEKFIESLFQNHKSAPSLPSPVAVCKVIDGLLKILFPELSNRKFESLREFKQHFNAIKLDLHQVLIILQDQLNESAEDIEKQFFHQLPAIRETLLKDAQAILNGDPAAKSLPEVIRTYPGFFAIAVYRIAHAFYELQVPLMPRILTEYAHGKTGIDIHPGAKIGENFFIDHGTGVVIGETVVIGANVKIYQGVTLGALSVNKNLAEIKRHPTIGDRVIIYSGATILGGKTVIGHDSVVGGNVWVTKSVPPHSQLYHQGLIKQKIRNGLTPSKALVDAHNEYEI